MFLDSIFLKRWNPFRFKCQLCRRFLFKYNIFRIVLVNNTQLPHLFLNLTINQTESMNTLFFNKILKNDKKQKVKNIQVWQKYPQLAGIDTLGNAILKIKLNH